MHLLQLIHSKSVQVSMMASGQNPQYLEYPLGSSGLNLCEIQFDVSSGNSPVKKKQCFPANKNPFIIFYLSLKLTRPEWPHNFIIFQQSLSTNSQIRGQKISSSLWEEFYAYFLLVYLCGGCSPTVLCLASFPLSPSFKGAGTTPPISLKEDLSFQEYWLHPFFPFLC